MADDLLISSDTHLYEPGDLWTTRLPRHLRERGLRSVPIPNSEAVYHKGLERHYCPNALDMASGRASHIDGKVMDFCVDDSDEVLRRFEADLAADGVSGAVIYPNNGMVAFLPDHELALAHARVYNDYVVEVFGKHLKRYAPAAIIPLTDVGDAVAEIERVAKMGLRNINVPVLPPKPYNTSVYDKVWATAQANDLVVSFHVGTGFDENHVEGFEEAFKMIAGAASMSDMIGIATSTRVLQFMGGQHTAERAIASLVCSGVMERFPDLHFCTVEFNAYWLASLVAAIEAAYVEFTGQDDQYPVGHFDPNRRMNDQPRMVKAYAMKWMFPLRPREYIARQVHSTFMNDPVALAWRNQMGLSVQSFLWGNDYPHNEGTWPNSKKVVGSLFADIPAADRSAILGGTTAKLFGLEPAACC